jgi:hypothetical protein
MVDETEQWGIHWSYGILHPCFAESEFSTRILSQSIAKNIYQSLHG